MTRKIPAGARNPTLLYWKLRGTVMYSATGEQVSTAPDPVMIPLAIPLSEKQWEVYRQLKDGVLAWLNAQGRVEVFDSGPVLAQLNYLMQLCADTRQLEISMARKRQANNILSFVQVRAGFSQNWSLADRCSKLKGLLWVLRANPDQQVLVLTGFRHVAREVSLDLRKLGYAAECLSGETTGQKRQDLVDRFHTKQTKVLTCTQAGWYGITLAAPIVVLFGFCSWVPGALEQAIKRAWTMLDQTPVQVYDLYSPNTVEAWNRNRVAQKAFYMNVLTNGKGNPVFASKSALLQALQGG